MSSDGGSLGSRPTRRTILRAGAGTLVGSALVGGPLASFASAATEDGSGGGNDVLTTAAIGASTPPFGQDDFVGLLVQVVGRTERDGSGDTPDCPSLEDKKSVPTFDIQLLHLTGEDKRASGGFRLFASTDDGIISPGQLYIVNGQEFCGDAYQLRLERIGASKIRVVEGEGRASGGSAPGFGLLAALAGFGLGALGHALDDD